MKFLTARAERFSDSAKAKDRVSKEAAKMSLAFAELKLRNTAVKSSDIKSMGR